MATAIEETQNFNSNSWFWSEAFWLPPNVTWEHFENDESTTIPQVKELLFIFPMAVILYFARILWERLIAVPIGRYYNVSEKLAKPPVPNTQLDAAFRKYGKRTPGHKILLGLSKQCDLTERKIEIWWRRKRLQRKPSVMTRFCETSWRYIFYATIFWFGVYCVYNKPWFWDTTLCYENYPRASIDPEVWWYYQITLAFYVSLIMSLLKDNKRSDFWQMNLHHICTILLLSMSWSLNFVRIGAIVILTHDAADPFLESAKMFTYLKFQKLCDILFVCFGLNWLVSRLMFYPRYVLYSAAVESWAGVGPYMSYYPFVGMLSILQVLHVFWFYLIIRMAISLYKNNGIAKDERSDSEEVDEESTEEEVISKVNGKKNGIHADNNANNIQQALN